ncbi:MAG: hypothetical protein HY701_02975 [Gemmatimonadetes bacterium]|nr:hypothetical protein [Gemmatimonadota bacterium]
MAGKLSPSAQVRLVAVHELLEKVQRAHGLVEQFAAAKDKAEQLTPQIKRAFAKLKMAFMGAGLDSMSQLAGSMEIASGRTTAQRTKARILREGVGSMRFQLELAERTITAEDAAKQQEKAAEKERERELALAQQKRIQRLREREKEKLEEKAATAAAMDDQEEGEDGEDEEEEKRVDTA